MEEHGPLRPTKRATPLTQTEIAQAALAMVDRDGVDKFSMRLLAEALGVTTMAVYHHFENRAEVLQAAADQVWIEVALSVEPHDDPVEELVQSLLTVRRVFLRHPDVTTFAVASPTTEQAVHLTAVAVTQRFTRAGFQADDVGLAYQVLATYTLGSALIYAERGILDRAIRQPVSDLASLAGGEVDADASEGADGRDGEAYRSVREAMGTDPDLVRFEQGLREITAALLDRLVTGR